CASIAKTSGSVETEDLTCYTIHDDMIRNYLKGVSSGCIASEDDIESNGIISVATLRSKLECASLSLSDVVSYSSVSSVNDITTLQGLEYAQGVDSDTDTPIGLTSLTLDGYDLSGDINDNAEYDKLVVQILAKAVTFGNIDSGLTHLSVSECGLSAITDVLDLTPRANGDSVTQPFKLTYLDLSNNSISDVSVLLTSDLFPADALTTLDISSNNICDIDNVVTDLQSKFTNLSTLIYSDQTCHCSATLTSSDHEVCREAYPDRWTVECWDGFYLDMTTMECVEAITDDEILRAEVCRREPNMMPILANPLHNITCGCRAPWYGDNCDQLYQIYLPSSNLRRWICGIFNNTWSSLCDMSEYQFAEVDRIACSQSRIHTLEGTEYAIGAALISFSNNPIYSVPDAYQYQTDKVRFLFGKTRPATMYEPPNITDLSWLEYFNRLDYAEFSGNSSIYDGSVYFKNISMRYYIPSRGDALTPICRSETDSDYWEFIRYIFPGIDYNYTDYQYYYLPYNSCELNSNANSTPWNCERTGPESSCPSMYLNEVYNPITETKECAQIAKQVGSAANSDLICYTIHDDQIRTALIANNLKNNSDDLESTGIISVPTLRSNITRSYSFNLGEDVSDMSSVTTLKGLEYAQGRDLATGYEAKTNAGLLHLNLNGYDLSYEREGSEYDRFVVRTLAKAVFKDTITYYGAVSYINTGLETISLSGCNLIKIEDVIDTRPPLKRDNFTAPFKLTDIDLSTNAIHDVSVFFSTEMFPQDVLTTVDLSENLICDTDGVVAYFEAYFTNLLSIDISDQGACPCSSHTPYASGSFDDHWTCTLRADGLYHRRCWNGYYLDLSTNKCVKACKNGYVLDDSVPDANGHPTCVSDTENVFVLHAIDNVARCNVCLNKSDRNLIPVMKYGDEGVTCGCIPGLYGDYCEYVFIPDRNLKTAVYFTLNGNPNYTEAEASEFDVLGTDISLMDMHTSLDSLEAHDISSFEGLQFATSLEDLFIYGDESSNTNNGYPIGDTDLNYLPDSLVNLVLSRVDLMENSDFSRFFNLVTLDISENPNYNLTQFSTFPVETLIQLNMDFNTSLSSVALYYVAELSNLVAFTCDSCNISDPSYLYILNGTLTVLSIPNNYVCGFDQLAILKDMFYKVSPLEIDNQSCQCDIEFDTSEAFAANKVCSETKPGSTAWYVVCASDSYISYTDASTFSCSSPLNSDNTTYGCAGGCAYGYECRKDSESDPPACQQVIVDVELHSCVADMFGDDETHVIVGTASDGVSELMLFSVASLKTLVSVFDIESDTYSPILSCNQKSLENLYGLNHLINVKHIELNGSGISDSGYLEALTSMTNLYRLYLASNPSLTFLPDISNVPLEILSLTSCTSLELPCTEDISQLLPQTIKRLLLYNMPLLTQTSFDAQIGVDNLPELEYLVIGNSNNIESIGSINPSIIKLFIFNMNVPINLQEDLNLLTELQVLNLTNLNGFTSIPDLSACRNTLGTLVISNNPDITSLVPLAEVSMSVLDHVQLYGCSVSDLSPLFDMQTILSVQASNNNICLGSNSDEVLAAKFYNYGNVDFNLDLGTDLTTSQSCQCSSIAYDIDSTYNPITDNIVCSETKPGSIAWYVVCASDSFTTYTDASTFTCTQPESATTNCSGGCEYGYECRYLGDDDNGDSEASCQPVIVDDNLRQYIADNLINDSTHMDDSDSSIAPKFSVASLRNISYPAVIDFDGSALLDSDRVCLLDGIEHLTSLSGILLPHHQVESPELLIWLNNIDTISFANNPSDGFSDLSFICSLHSL
ncbi:hypothetical protein ADUPG1_008824, partial [Aduncisulcus paluster]